MILGLGEGKSGGPICRKFSDDYLDHAGLGAPPAGPRQHPDHVLDIWIRSLMWVALKLNYF